MEYVTLNNEMKCPVVGIGTFMLSPADAENSVREALIIIDVQNDYFPGGSFCFGECPGTLIWFEECPQLSDEGRMAVGFFVPAEEKYGNLKKSITS